MQHVRIGRMRRRLEPACVSGKNNQTRQSTKTMDAIAAPVFPCLTTTSNQIVRQHIPARSPNWCRVTGMQPWASSLEADPAPGFFGH